MTTAAKPTKPPTPSAAQVRALLDRARNGRLTAAEQRVLADLFADTRASLAGTAAALRAARGEIDRLAAPDQAPAVCRAGQNAEDCPPGAHPALPYPFTCPGAATQPEDEPTSDEIARAYIRHVLTGQDPAVR